MKLIKYVYIVLATLVFAACQSDSNSAKQSEVGGGSQDGQGGSLAVFALKGNYLYTVDSHKLHVFNIQETSNPVQVNSVPVSFDIETLFSLDHYLFLGARSGMYIYDISNPENPVQMSKSVHFNACDPVVATQTHAYVTLHSNSACGNNVNLLEVYDITDVENPVLVHQRNLMKPIGLALYNNEYLIVCDDELKIFSIENPENPQLIHSVNKRFIDVAIYNSTLFAFGENQIAQFKWEGDDFLTLEEVSALDY